MLLLRDSPLGQVVTGVIHDWLTRLGGASSGGACDVAGRKPPSRANGDRKCRRKYRRKCRRKYRRKYRAVSRRYLAKVAECLELAASNQAMRDEIRDLQAKLLASAARFKHKSFELQCELHFEEPTAAESPPPPP